MAMPFRRRPELTPEQQQAYNLEIAKSLGISPPSVPAKASFSPFAPTPIAPAAPAAAPVAATSPLGKLFTRIPSPIEAPPLAPLPLPPQQIDTSTIEGLLNQQINLVKQLIESSRRKPMGASEQLGQRLISRPTLRDILGG